MRYFLLISLPRLRVVTVVGIAGRRGSLSRRPPIELFPDMNRQPKLRPQTPDTFFADGRSSRMPIPGTIAQEDTHYEDLPVNTGRVTGTTNFVETIPVPVTATLLARGQQRFNINCSPCHGMQADGNGVVKKAWQTCYRHSQSPRQAHCRAGGRRNLQHHHLPSKNTLGPYGANVTIEDRWAIISYLRALRFEPVGQH